MGYLAWRSLSRLYFQWNPCAKASAAKIQMRGDDLAKETMSMPTAVSSDVWMLTVATVPTVTSRSISTATNDNKPKSALLTKIMEL